MIRVVTNTASFGLWPTTTSSDQHCFFRVVAYHYFQAIWHMPGQTSRPSGRNCQANFQNVLPRIRLAAPAQGRTREGCPAAGQQSKSRNTSRPSGAGQANFQAIWQMPGQTSRPSGTRQAKTSRPSSGSWAKPPRLRLNPKCAKAFFRMLRQQRYRGTVAETSVLDPSHCLVALLSCCGLPLLRR